MQQNRKLIRAKETLQLWERYLKGENNFQSGGDLPSHSIMAQIQRMVDKDFMFRSFNDVCNKMIIRTDFEDYFSSNQYLVEIMRDWYFTSQ